MKITKQDTPYGLKTAFYVPLSIEKNKKGVEISGICSFCSRWSAELRNGNCLELDCIRGRELEAIAQGTIELNINGLIGGIEIKDTNNGRLIINPNKNHKEKTNRFGLKKLKALKAKQEEQKLLTQQDKIKDQEEKEKKIALKAEWKKLSKNKVRSM